jgi:hypothetical protein
MTSLETAGQGIFQLVGIKIKRGKISSLAFFNLSDLFDKLPIDLGRRLQRLVNR